MKKETKEFYTPDVSEFHVGFEYDALDGFLDGTLKSTSDYRNSKWNKNIVTNLNDLPFIDRALTGMNAENGIKGITVKNLDRDDIEDLGLTVFELDMGDYFASYIKKGKDIVCGWFPNDKIDNIEITDTLFTIKNKTELRKLMQQIGIEVKNS